MPTSFYVKNLSGALVPAWFLTNQLGNPIIDENTQWAKGIRLYDTEGNYLGNNTSGYVVAPANYSLDKSTEFGNFVKSLYQGPLGSSFAAAFGAMAASFYQGAGQDLQRTYQDYNGNLVTNAPMVVAFQSVASLHLGATTAVSGLPLSVTEVAGGVVNLFFGGSNTSGFAGNHPRNVNSMEQGYGLLTPPPPLQLNFTFSDADHGINYVFNNSSGGTGSVTIHKVTVGADTVADATVHYTGGLVDLLTVTVGNGSNIKFTYDTSNQEQSRLDKVDFSRPDGAKTTIDFDQDSTKEWSLQGIKTGPDGQPLAKVEVADNGAVASAQYFGATLTGEIGQALGSSLGKVLGGNSLIGKVAAGTVIGTIGKEIGQALTYGGAYTLDVAVKDAFGTLGGGAGVGALPSAAIGAVSSLLIGELAKSLRLTGFEGGLFTTAGTTITTQLITNAYGMMTGATYTAPNGVQSAYTMFSGFDAASLATNLGGLQRSGHVEFRRVVISALSSR